MMVMMVNCLFLEFNRCLLILLFGDVHLCNNAFLSCCKHLKNKWSPNSRPKDYFFFVNFCTDKKVTKKTAKNEQLRSFYSQSFILIYCAHEKSWQPTQAIAATYRLFGMFRRASRSIDKRDLNPAYHSFVIRFPCGWCSATNLNR